MANTKYQELVDVFYDKITDNMFTSIPESVANDIVTGYIPAAVSSFENCDQDLSIRDDVLQEFGFELSKTNFQILVNYMVIEWLTVNYINTASALKSRLTTSDFHSLQLPNMLSKALSLRETLKSENDQLAINKSYKTTNLFDIVTRKKVE